MTTTSNFRKIFFGILILLFAGIFWMTMQTCQKAENSISQGSGTATETLGKISDTATPLKDKSLEMAADAAKSSGGVIDNAADKTGDIAGKAADRAGEAYKAAGEMADKAADKAGEAYKAAGEMAGKAADKAGEAYKAAGEIASKAAEKAGEAIKAAGDMAGKAAENTGETFKAAGDIAGKAADEAGKTFQSNDGASDADENTKDRRVEVAAQYKAGGFGNTDPQTIKSPVLTADGNWLFEDLEFDYNQSDLNPSAFTSLRELAATLKARPELNIEIQGHTDSSGARDYNLDLSQSRAQSVKTFLVSEGIDASRMTIRGFGPDRPMYSNASEEGFAKNRRVEIKLLN